MKQPRKLPPWTTVRDLLLFFSGLTGVAHEVLFTAGERPSLLIMFAAMMGLPAFLQKPPEDKQ